MTQNTPDTDLALRDVANAHSPPKIGQWVMRLLVCLILYSVVCSVAGNPNFGWPIVAHWFFERSVLEGLGVTLGLSAIAMAIGVVLGLILAIARMSKDILISSLANLYIWFFRGTPLLVQLIFWYNMSSLYPEVSIGIPFFGPTFYTWNTNDLITPMTAAIGGLALNEAAYMAEIIRGGLLSVDRGQIEATEAFGMSRMHALLRIILPQAMRSIIPPTGNQFISLIKATSLVSVIAMSDLLYSVQTIYNRTFEIIPLLLVAVIYYLIVTSILSIGQSFIERYYSKSDRNGNNTRPSSDN